MTDAARAGGALEAARSRRSWSKVTDEAPTHAELLTLVSAAGRVADHSSLHPWRLIELRGDDRVRLGEAIARAQGDDSPSMKPLRAPLLIAVVASYRPSAKVPRWEQEAVASGVAHMLSLLLDEAGWGVIWRTGHYTRSTAVARAHGLGDDEELLGWLYVGGKPDGSRDGRRKEIDAARFVTRMPEAAGPGGPAAAEERPDTRSTASKKDKKQEKKDKNKEKKKEKKRRKAERKKQKRRLRAERDAARP